MADLIDRQAAIKAIEDLQDCYNGFSDTYDKACIIGVLEEIPTAQVNTPTDTPTDTISRQAAIDALHQWEQEYTWDEYDAKYSPSVVSPSDVIAELPSAQRTGRWKVSDLPKGKMKYCSECGFGQYIADERRYGFCPNCGAEMIPDNAPLPDDDSIYG